MSKPAESSKRNGKTAPARRPITQILPDADEEYASVAMVNKWVDLADAALVEKDSRKRA